MRNKPKKANIILKALENLQYSLAALGIILVLSSSLGVLYFKSISMLGTIAGLGFSFLWFIVAVPWVLIKQNKKKSWIFTGILFASILNFILFNTWQFLGQYAFFIHKRRALNELSSLSLDNALHAAVHFMMEGDTFKINMKDIHFNDSLAVFQYDIRDTSIKNVFLKTTKADTVSAAIIRKIAVLMKVCGTVHVRKHGSCLIVEIGGMLDTRYGFLRKKNAGEITDEERKNLDRFGHYLRKMIGPWYYYNTGS